MPTRAEQEGGGRSPTVIARSFFLFFHAKSHMHIRTSFGIKKKKKKKEDMRTKGEEGSKCEISKPKFDLRESKTKLDQSDRDCVQRNGVMAEICKREGLEVEGS